MLTVRDHLSGDLFDPWEYLGPQRRRVLQQSWAGVFRDYLLQHLPVKELAASFRDDFGRPSKDLHVALGALILPQLHDLADQQTTEAIALNIAWHYALDIRREPDASLCERTLRNYRCKILELAYSVRPILTPATTSIGAFASAAVAALPALQRTPTVAFTEQMMH